ncbi:MAG: hypothetical protein ACREDR_03955, partial [Blastocatellia bacterium]
MSRARVKACFKIALAILVLISLAGCGHPDPPPWSEVIPPTKAGEPSALTADQLVIYLDESGSMQGYVSKDGQSIYGKTLRALRDVATTVTPFVDLYTRRVDAGLGKPSRNADDLSSASLDPRLYNGSETNLVAAIDAFKEPLLVNGAVKQPARFHVLVTDGVQSTYSGRGNCASGSDEVCVRERILKLLKAGWGGCVVGIKSDFHGTLYSEINRAAGRPYAIPYDTDGKPPEGFRPFYLYLFSPDNAQLDSFVKALKEKLRQIVKKDGLRELPLTLPYVDRLANASVEVPKESRDFITAARQEEVVPARVTVRVSMDTEKRGSKAFQIKVALPWSEHAK